ncbi:MAG: hypothetical protein ACRDWY_11820, partial [Actinomycetes bacterium]
ATPTAATGSAPAASGAAQSPKLNPPPAPSLPALPALPGSGGSKPAPPSRGGGGSQPGGTPGGSPVGDDVLPAALEKELCTVLTTLLGPLPAQVKGLPAGVVAQLPAQITDLVPADVLATVTLQCPSPATPTAAAATEVRGVQAGPANKAASATRSPQRATPAGLSALPHTGMVAALPVLGGGMLLLGLAIRRRAGGGSS